MCGNAIRCIGKYLYDNGIVKKTAHENRNAKRH
jgi:diaminopimelate epimerase